MQEPDKRARMTIYPTDEQKRLLRIAAAHTGQSMNEFILGAIAMRVDQVMCVASPMQERQSSEGG